MDKYAQPQRPEKEIETLISAMADCGEWQNTDQGQTISSGVNDVVIVHSGELALLRSMDEIMLAETRKPLIVGIVPFEEQSRYFTLKAKSACLVQVIERAHFDRVIEEQQLWKPLLAVLAWYYQYLYWKSYHYVAKSTYTLIRNCLLELMQLDEKERETINACDYTIQKTGLSQSFILKVFQELKKGGYIKMARGRLVDVERLPERY